MGEFEKEGSDLLYQLPDCGHVFPAADFLDPQYVIDDSYCYFLIVGITCFGLLFSYQYDAE